MSVICSYLCCGMSQLFFRSEEDEAILDETMNQEGNLSADNQIIMIGSSIDLDSSLAYCIIENRPLQSNQKNGRNNIQFPRSNN